ncbi:MAG: hypothetical protein CGU28_03695 [Candidatus Dactylopiibacterium carminicum]|nr:MAG: hypothetical protein CGU28_03695 [Candidatus Dactylopiibacterium carminicum]
MSEVCAPDAGTVTPALIEQVCQALAGGNAARPDIDAELRQAFPGFTFSCCLDNDIPSRLRPLAEGKGFTLYGIATAGHCAQLTPHIEAATGLTIALKDDDDDE